MFTNKRNIFIRIIAMILVVVIFTPVHVKATSSVPSPKASYYLDSYNTYIYPAGWGKVQVWFTVTGITYMDDIGALTIKVYESTDQENWTWVETFTNGDTPSMLGHNKYYYSGHVEYSGTIGRYYKAYVTIWAGKDGDGDTRYMWTDVRKATLLAG